MKLKSLESNPTLKLAVKSLFKLLHFAHSSLDLFLAHWDSLDLFGQDLVILVILSHIWGTTDVDEWVCLHPQIGKLIQTSTFCWGVFHYLIVGKIQEDVMKNFRVPSMSEFDLFKVFKQQPVSFSLHLQSRGVVVKGFSQVEFVNSLNIHFHLILQPLIQKQLTVFDGHRLMILSITWISDAW